jgi:hypothetical protein
MSAVATASASRRVLPGDGLLHPVAIAAIAVLVLNDHLLKAAFPGPITGKISDFCGLVFFPLAVQAICELGTGAFGRDTTASRRVLLAALAATGIGFAAIKLVPEINAVAEWTLGWLQWAAGVFVAPAPSPTRIALDATDLVALPALGLAWLIGMRRIRSGGA